ncbi:MAG: recombinase family protein [Ruminiclostridium sp.]
MLARKSRKNIIENETVENNLLRVAGYIRLSVNKADQPSDSIENQKKIIEGYSETNLGLQFEKFYIDDKSSGRDFNRPAFNEMLEDIRAGKINCVIVKDLSRLGRSLIDVGYYVQMFFPSQKVRFISIANGIDTLDGMTNITFGKLPSDRISLTSLMDEQYAIDISKKAQSVLNDYIKEGKHVAPRAPYGYRKSDSDCHTLVPDVKSAVVVKDIFSMALSKISINEIVRRLNTAGTLTPISYAISQGLKGNYNQGNGLWNSRTVKDILTNQTYVGDLQQGKDKHVVQNTHEPLVRRDVFDAVQQLISAGASISPNKTNAPREDNILRGKVICGCCGSKMQRRKGSGNAIWYFFTCISNNRLGVGYCTGMYIREADIMNAILHEAKSYIHDNEVDSLTYVDQKAVLEANAKQLEQQINEQREVSRSRYENFIMGIADKDDLVHDRNKRETLHAELQDVNNQIKGMNEKHEQYLLFCNALNDKGKVGQLIADYILNVSVLANGQINVKWRDS